MEDEKSGEVRERYLFLNNESINKMKAFIRVLWKSDIPKQYGGVHVSNGLRRELDKRITLEEYFSGFKKKDLSSRLIIAQESSMGKLIRFLNGNSRGEDFELCWIYNDRIVSSIEKLFKKTFKYGFENYPHQEVR